LRPGINIIIYYYYEPMVNSSLWHFGIGHWGWGQGEGEIFEERCYIGR
jgi:hypothetical protein